MAEESPRDVIDRFYESLRQKNDVWKDLWADDALFRDSSGTLRAEGRAACIESYTPFLKDVVGLEVRQTIVQGSTACYVIGYDYVNSKAERLHQDDAEIWEVRDGKLARMTIFFDLTLYRSFMRR